MKKKYEKKKLLIDSFERIIYKYEVLENLIHLKQLAMSLTAHPFMHLTYSLQS